MPSICYIQGRITHVLDGIQQIPIILQYYAVNTYYQERAFIRLANTLMPCFITPNNKRIRIYILYIPCSQSLRLVSEYKCLFLTGRTFT